MANSAVDETFRHNVMAIMETLELSVAELARRLGVARPNISRILHGHESVSLERADRIAQALEVPLTELLSKSPAKTRLPKKAKATA